MKRDEYSTRQAARDADYERNYRDWVRSLPPEEQRQLEKQGLALPMVARHGNGAPNHDMAESSRASHTPDIAALVDHEQKDREETSMHNVTDVLRHFVADLLSEGNTRLTVECLAIALGLSAYEGETMTEIAQRHGITRAAVSKRCVDITQRLNLPPSRAMRSTRARRIYQKAQLKRNRYPSP
jgi:hypothetical protein